MAWIVVPCLEDLRFQLNTVAPNRDKSSDGSIGDTSHAAGRSSHNPDRTGAPEHADGDAADEIRARDFDKDLREPGLTMAMVVRHFVLGCRSGRFWWIRYIIFDGIIYHKSSGFVAREYTGANKHDQHAHVNSDFTQAADTVRGVNYGLDELVALNDTDLKKISDLISASEQRIRADIKAEIVARIDDILSVRIGDSAHPARTFGQLLNDLGKLRGYLVGDGPDTVKAAIPLTAPIVRLIALADKLEPIQSGPIGTEQLVTAVKTALREGVGE